jgi:hypothetical protein
MDPAERKNAVNADYSTMFEARYIYAEVVPC